MKTNRHCKSFTLIELVVSMSVLAVLMMIMMSFFSAAQQAWTSSSSRSEVYDNARVGMDLIARDLQTSIYQTDQTPFWHCDLATPEPDTHTKEMLAFITSTSIRPNDYCSSSCEVKYKLYYTTDPGDKLAGWLMRSVTGDVNNDNTTNVYSSTNLSGKWNFQGNFDVGKSGVTNVFTRDDSSGGDMNVSYDQGDFVKIIPYVTKLSFQCFDNNNALIAADPSDSDFTLNSTGHDNAYPSMIKITLKMLDKSSWQKWLAIGGSPQQALDDSDSTAAQNFRKEHERTFTKLIFLKR